MKDPYVNNSMEVGFKAFHILLSVSDMCCSNAGFPCKISKYLMGHKAFNEAVQPWGHTVLCGSADCTGAQVLGTLLIAVQETKRWPLCIMPARTNGSHCVGSHILPIDVTWWKAKFQQPIRECNDGNFVHLSLCSQPAYLISTGT